MDEGDETDVKGFESDMPSASKSRGPVSGVDVPQKEPDRYDAEIVAITSDARAGNRYVDAVTCQVPTGGILTAATTFYGRSEAVLPERID